MRLSPLGVVKAFAVVRCGFGVAFLVAPGRLARGEDLLITRSFAVRELVIGVGGIQSDASAAAEWARLGSLVDAGDAVAAGLAVARRVPFGVPALVTALGGLALEGWAARRLSDPGLLASEA